MVLSQLLWVPTLQIISPLDLTALKEMQMAQDSVRETGFRPSYLTLIHNLEQTPELDRIEADVLKSSFQF